MFISSATLKLVKVPQVIFMLSKLDFLKLMPFSSLIKTLYSIEELKHWVKGKVGLSYDYFSAIMVRGGGKGRGLHKVCIVIVVSAKINLIFLQTTKSQGCVSFFRNILLYFKVLSNFIKQVNT